MSLGTKNPNKSTFWSTVPPTWPSDPSTVDAHTCALGVLRMVLEPHDDRNYWHEPVLLLIVDTVTGFTLFSYLGLFWKWLFPADNFWVYSDFCGYSFSRSRNSQITSRIILQATYSSWIGEFTIGICGRVKYSWTSQEILSNSSILQKIITRKKLM